MSLFSQLKPQAVTLAVVIAAAAIAFSLYERFFSDKAQLIKVLEKQIKEQEQHAAELEQELARLNVEEQKRLEEIAALKSKIADVQEMITQREVNLNEIKNQFILLDEALDVIERRTRGARSAHRVRAAEPDSSARR
jgi:peptidoglycan hydrolase CwlO-like protein